MRFVYVALMGFSDLFKSHPSSHTNGARYPAAASGFIATQCGWTTPQISSGGCHFSAVSPQGSWSLPEVPPALACAGEYSGGF